MSRLLLLLLLGLVGTRDAFAGWRYFGPEVGPDFLPVLCMTQDSTSGIWVGTGFAGVQRFDGVGWTRYSMADGLPDTHVGALYTATDGTVWAGTFAGLVRFDGSRWRAPADEPDGLKGSHISIITGDRSGVLWLVSQEAIWRYDGNAWNQFPRVLGVSFINTLYADRDGVLWAGSDIGLLRYDGSTVTTYTTANGLPFSSIGSIAEDANGTLWIGSAWPTGSSGLARKDGSTWTLVPIPGQEGRVQGMLFDSRGNLWLSCLNGGTNATEVLRYDGFAWRNDLLPPDLRGGTPARWMEDREGNLWVVNGGLLRFDGVEWGSLPLLSYTGFSGCRCPMLSDGSGNVWLSASSYGVFRIFADTAATKYTSANGLGGNEVRCLYQDRAGNVWAGCDLGASEFTGSGWVNYFSGQGISGYFVVAIHQDSRGDYWFVTENGGISRFDGQTWTTYSTGTGLPTDSYRGVIEDRSGNLWFHGNAVTRYDGNEWRSYFQPDIPVSTQAYEAALDSTGAVWFFSYVGFGRLDAAGWHTFPEAPDHDLSAPFFDHRGNLWAAGHEGVVRYDGQSWTTYKIQDGLAAQYVTSILEDRFGHMWFGGWDGGTGGGASEFDPGTGVWRTFRKADGLADDMVMSLLEDRRGTLWFSGNLKVLTRHSPDRIPSQTVFLTKPPPVSASRHQSAAFVAGYGESDGIRFSYRLDGAPWSPWSAVGAWTDADLTDGPHVLQARSHDPSGNIDAYPPSVRFEIDSSPPAALLTAPGSGQAVHGSVEILGRADDPRFQSYRVEVTPLGTDSVTSIAESTTPVANGILASWNTSSLPDGEYDLRLSVTDTLGLTGVAQALVVVDNVLPHADQTAPAVVSASTGGDLYSANGKMHLYFPPHTFDRDALVTIEPPAFGSIPDTLSPGIARALDGFIIGWEGASLHKPFTIELSTAAVGSSSGVLAFYTRSTDSTWTRLGGTRDGDEISSTARTPGAYSIFVEAAPVSIGGAISDLSFSPRVFSPSGGFAHDHVDIGFTLGRDSPVTISVYARSGRLVREVVSGRAMQAGRNLVSWDGTDRDGSIVPDDLYLVTVEASDRTLRRTLAVVR